MGTIRSFLAMFAMLNFALFYSPIASAQGVQTQEQVAPDYAAIDAHLQSELQALHMPGTASGTSSIPLGSGAKFEVDKGGMSC